MEKASCRRNLPASSCPRCRAERIAPKYHSDSRSLRQSRNVGRPKADGLKITVNAAARVIRRPARRVFEQTNGANAAISAEIEPVEKAGRHSDQVACFDLDGDYGAILRMKVIQTTTFNDEAHLVVVVPVLAVEFGQHLIQALCLRFDVDHVRRDVTAALFELLYLGRIRGQNIFRWRVSRDR